MSDIAIKVQNLSKRYRIGLKEEMHDTFAAALTDWMTRPVRNFRRLRRLTRFDDRRLETGDGENRSSVLGPPSVEDDIIWALKDVSFEVKRGEVVGIIGRNGAGKSTLLKILSHITYPTSGRVELHGRVSSLLEVGTGFHTELTGRENIYLNGTILGMTKAEIDKKFDEIVDFSGVEKFIDTPVKRYSSGMRVRLAFSVAAHLEPEILLVDEVLAVGDVGFQKKCLGKMGEVARGGRTVLFVSHNMGAITALTDRSILLDNGIIAVDGPTTQAIEIYLAAHENGTCKEVLLDTDEIELLKFLLNGEEKKHRFDRGDNIQVSIVVKIKKRLPSLSVGFDLLNSSGYLLFRTYHDDDDTGRIPIEPGVYKYTCNIPTFMLNQGDYIIDFRSGIRGIKRLGVIKNVTSFHLTCNQKRTHKQKPGIICPDLKWQAEKL